MSLFEKRIPYKPFEYPEYYTDGWILQNQAHWLHTEIPMSSDVKDWNENLTENEKHVVGNILLGFAQTECAVSDYWTGMVTDWFPKHEIIQMAICFGAQETIHAAAYSYLNDTLGLDDYEGFMHEPAIAGRIESLTSVPHQYNYKILCTSAPARRDVARSLAIFSAFTEGVALYSSFAVLYSFQLNNKLKGIGQQMKWSVRDEALHSKMGCQLFRHMCEEFPELKADAKDAIMEAAKLTLEMEMNFIDKIFEINGEKNWVFHGDVFDRTTKGGAKIIAKLGGYGYDLLILINSLVNWSLKLMGKEKMSFSKNVKNGVKKAVSWINNFEQTAAELAIENNYQYVICGHIHQPQQRVVTTEKGSVTYLNSGDWIENLTSLEYYDNAWKLYHYDPKQFQNEIVSKNKIINLNYK